MTRACKIIDDEMFNESIGYSKPWNGEYGINIQSIWERSESRSRKKTEDAIFELFARDFALTVAHELLHIEIYHAMPKKYRYRHRETNQYLKREEKILYKMLNEKWFKIYDIFYEKYFPYKKKGMKKKCQHPEKMNLKMIL